MIKGNLRGFTLPEPTQRMEELMILGPMKFTDYLVKYNFGINISTLKLKFTIFDWLTDFNGMSTHLGLFHE